MNHVDQSINKKANKRSLFFAYFEAIPYALIPLIWIVSFPVPSGLSGSILQAVVVTLSKDFLSAIVYLMIITIKGELFSTISLLKGKAGWFALIAGIFGGPIGYVLFNSAFLYTGPSFGHIFTSLEPIFLVLSGIFFLKRKYTWKMYLGIGITLFAIIALVFGDAFQNGEWWKIVIGALLGIGGSLSWAIETVLFDKAFNFVDGEKDTNKLLTIKTFFSVLFGFIIMIPMISGIATSQDDSFANSGTLGYELFSNVFTNNDYLWRFFTAGTLILIGRYMYFYAIERQGGTLVAVVYNLSIILTPLFSLIYFGISNEWIGTDLFSRYGIVLLSVTPILIIGILLVTLNKPKIFRPEDEKENLQT